MSFIQPPIGAVFPFAGASAPNGYLLCDGSSLLRTDYPALFSAIGTAHGAADGTHFNLPDLRGRFVRGVDGAAGRDPNAGARTAANPGGNTGNAVGTVQPDDFKSHDHDRGSGFSVLISVGGDVAGGSGFHIGGVDPLVAPRGGSETRPINANMNYIIKV